MGIQGKRKIELTMETILNKVNPLEVFYYYIPDKQWKLNEAMCSPLREDKHPSFIVGNRYGNILFKDFSVENHKGDIFNFVKIMFNLSTLDEVLRKIDTDLGLGISGEETKAYEKVKKETKHLEITKRNTLLQVVTRKFLKNELDYWESYHQDVEDLKANNIYSIKKVFLNKKLYHIGDEELRFGYFYPKGGWWKIYVPYADKKRKWLGNTPLQTSWGTENLNKDHNSLILKSLKDYMVCKKIYPYVCGIQNESLAAFSEEFVETVKNNSKVVYYGGDSDIPGKQASYAITGAFGFKHINPPDNLLPDIKDMADWGKSISLKALEEHFKIKGLL